VLKDTRISCTLCEDHIMPPADAREMDYISWKVKLQMTWMIIKLYWGSFKQELSRIWREL
jgi:hypothetical protein